MGFFLLLVSLLFMVEEASMYASYAGRKSLIDSSDVELAQNNGGRIGASRQSVRARALRRRPRRALSQDRMKLHRLNELVRVRMLEQ